MLHVGAVWRRLIAVTLGLNVAATGASGNVQVEVSDGRVTLAALDARTQDVVDQLALASGLVVVSHSSLEGRLTLALNRLPLHEALKRILPDRSFLLYQPAGAAPVPEDSGSASRLWIFSTGSPRALEAPRLRHTVGAGRQAVKGARQLDWDEAQAPLSRALVDEDAIVRVKAIYAMAHTGGHLAVGALAPALVDANVGVREEAAYTLGTIGTDATIPFLELALRDADPGVRSVAIRSLAGVATVAAIGALAQAMRDPDSLQRQAAVGSLGKIGGDAAVRVLRYALEDQDEAVRRAAETALAELSTAE